MGQPTTGIKLSSTANAAPNVLNGGGLRIKVLTESPATDIFSREMIMYTRIGATAGVSSAVKSLVSAAS